MKLTKNIKGTFNKLNTNIKNKISNNNNSSGNDKPFNDIDNNADHADEEDNNSVLTMDEPNRNFSYLSQFTFQNEDDLHKDITAQRSTYTPSPLQNIPFSDKHTEDNNPFGTTTDNYTNTESGYDNDDQYSNQLKRHDTYAESICYNVTLYKTHSNDIAFNMKSEGQQQQEYKDLLDQASNSNTTILLELNLDGTIKYLSDHLFILHKKDHILGNDISNFLGGSDLDKSVFHRTTELLLKDDQSYKIKFTLPRLQDNGTVETSESESVLYFLEAQGVLINDVFTNKPSFTMWIIKPIFDIDELDELPDQLVEKLGFGATLFNERLHRIGNITDINDIPEDKTEICRICETPIADWWLETHCRLCLYEHNLYDKIVICQDKLKSYKKTFLEIKSKLVESDASPVITPLNDDINIQDISSPSLLSTINLFLNFCDDSLSVNNSELKRLTSLPILENIVFQFSPTSQKSIENVQNWKERLLSVALQIESGKSYSQDCFVDILLNTIKLGDLKVTRMMRLKHTQQYHMRLKTEIYILTNEVIKQRIESSIINNTQKNNHLSSINNINVLDSPFSQKGSDNWSSTVPSLQRSEEPHSVSKISPPDEVFVSANESDDRAKFYQSNNLTESFSGLNLSLSNRAENITPNSKSFDHIRDSSVITSDDNISINSKTGSINNKGFLSESNYITSNSMSPTSTGGLNFANPDVNPTNLKSSNINIPNISVATSILQRKSSVSSSRHGNTSAGPKRSSPLVTYVKVPNNNVPTLSSIQKNPTTKSVFVRSPLASPFSPELKAHGVSSLNNPFSLNTDANDSNLLSLPKMTKPDLIQKNSVDPLFDHPALELHKSSLGSVLVPSSANKSRSNSRTGSKPDNSTEHSKSFSSISTPSISSKAFNINPSIKHYEIVKPISKGAFGSVYLAKRKATGDYVSIKCLKKADMISKNQVTNVKTERAVMMTQISKSYVAQLYATFQNKEHLFLVMEYLVGGDLRTLIEMVGPLPSKWIKQYISEIIVGVSDMHKDGIIHHDIKPDNLLLDRNGHVKFIDFGLSRLGLVNRQRTNNENNVRLNSGSMSKSHSRSLHRSLYDSSFGSSSSLPQLQKHHDGSFSQSKENKTPTSEDGKFDFINKNSSSFSNNMMDTDSGSSAIYEVSNYGNTGNKGVFSMTGNNAHNLFYSEDTGNSIDADNATRSSTPPSSIPHANLEKSGSTYSYTNSPLGSNKSMRTSVDKITNYVIFDPDATNKNFKFMGTPDYIAPEVIKGFSETPMCDWWSVGCLLFEFHFAYPPFHADSPGEVFEKILECEINWPEFEDEDEESLYITPEAKDLIKRLLVINPKDRIGYKNVEEITQHPYFDDLDWDNVYNEEAEFVPNVSNPEDTDYFDNRGLSMNIDFQNEDSNSATGSSGQNNSDASGNSSDTSLKNSETDDDIRTKSNNQKPATIGSFLHPSDTEMAEDFIGNESKNLAEEVLLKSTNSSMKKSSSSVSTQSSKSKNSNADFGTFKFRNIRALNKANKDVINRLKNEHQSVNSGVERKSSSASNGTNSSNKHSRTASLTALFGTMASPSSSNSLGMVLNDSSGNLKKLGSIKSDNSIGIVSLHGSDLEEQDTKSACNVSRFNSIPSTPGKTVSDDMNNLSKNVIRDMSVPTSDNNDTEENEIPKDLDLVLLEEKRLEAVAKLQNIKKFRKMSTLSHSLGANTTGGSSRRPSTSSNGNGTYESSLYGGDMRTASSFTLSNLHRSNQLKNTSSDSSEVMDKNNIFMASSLSNNDMKFDLDILLCESIPIHTYLMKNSLEKCGCRVVTVATGDELVRRAVSDVKFDIIFSTFFSSNLNCIDIFKLIRNTNGANCSTPFIVLTAYYEEAFKINVFDGVVEKPITESQLRSILSKYALRKAQEREDTLLSDVDSDILLDF
ncbi:hypothetical protein ACO0OE_000599 [Hanseniaspora uvarum]